MDDLRFTSFLVSFILIVFILEQLDLNIVLD